MLTRTIAFFFALAVIVIPFDAIPGFTPFGELAHEASFYFFAIALILAFIKFILDMLSGTHAGTEGRLLQRATFAILATILISALWNASDVATATFHDRAGFAKMLTAMSVVLYGIALALLTRSVVPTRWYSALVMPISISAILCVVFSTFEALNRMGLGNPLYHAIDSLIHGGVDLLVQPWDGATNEAFLNGWDDRLRSVSFEPPAFGNFSGYAWPWLLAAVFMTQRWRRAFHVLLLAAFTVLIVASEARTARLLLAANVVTFGLLMTVFLPRHGHVDRMVTWLSSTALALSAALIATYYLLELDVVPRNIVTASVSDLTRTAYQVSAAKIFSANAFFGVGLGQFAFKVTSFMPSWGLESPEITTQLTFPDAPWPNTYSLYARIAAELGALGILVWLTIWLTLMAAVRRAGLIYARFARPVPVVAYAIIMNCITVFVAAITTDTFRTPMIWIALGAGACLDGRARHLARQLVETPEFDVFRHQAA
ncbi:MAG: hypothetical protein FWD68_18080 [Alphaproteobacteria bacterium]|nr:hypothetical protein [Alphaproteobacteria bacterium]